MKYDKEVLTINDILTALDNFDNKEEIINAIKRSLYDIETDWHHEEYLRQQLQAYKQKEDKLREMFKSEKLENLNKYYYGDSYELDAHELRNDILQILNEGSDKNE